MVFLPTPAEPFGLLQPLYLRVLEGQAITSTNWPWAVMIPMLPLALMSYLLQYENTRPYRIALGVLGNSMLLSWCASYRYIEPRYNAFNIGFGTAAVHLFGKYFEFALLRGPIVDPFRKRGRGRMLATMDLPLNTRRVYLEPLDISDFSFGANHRLSNGHSSSLNGLETESSIKPEKGLQPLRRRKDVTQIDGSPGTSLVHEAKVPSDDAINKGVDIPGILLYQWRYLPQAKLGRTRLQASLRHLGLFITHCLALDALMGLLKAFASDTIGNSAGIHRAVDVFIATHDFYLFPYLRNSSLTRLLVSIGFNETITDFQPPTWFVEVVVMSCIATITWQGLTMAYRFIAFWYVATGIYEVEAWEVDLFNQPWKADSVLDMWGRRWHQVFRSHFILCATAILRFFHLPVKSLTLLPLVFFLSGIFHGLGELMSFPVPYPPDVMRFFFLSGVGAACEGLFKRMTGRKVRGKWGRLWTWIFFFVAGRSACWAWCDSGVGGAPLVPQIPGVEWSIAPLFVRLFSMLVADVVPKDGVSG